MKSTSTKIVPESIATVHTRMSSEGFLTITIEGRLDSITTGTIWRESTEVLDKTPTKKLLVDASKINYCDGSGIGLFVELRRRQQSTGGEMELRGLRSEFFQLLNLFNPKEFAITPLEKPKKINLTHHCPVRNLRVPVFVIPECFYSGIQRFVYHRFPLKTCGNDSFRTRK